MEPRFMIKERYRTRKGIFKILIGLLRCVDDHLSSRNFRSAQAWNRRRTCHLALERYRGTLFCMRDNRDRSAKGATNCRVRPYRRCVGTAMWFWKLCCSWADYSKVFGKRFTEWHNVENDRDMLMRCAEHTSGPSSLTQSQRSGEICSTFACKWIPGKKSGLGFQGFRVFKVRGGGFRFSRFRVWRLRMEGLGSQGLGFRV
jgi:hypothetical protein